MQGTRVANVRGEYAKSGEDFALMYADIIEDNRWAWRNMGNRFSPPPMTYRWIRA